MSLTVPVLVPLGSPAARSSADGPLTGRGASAAGGAGADCAAGTEAALWATAGRLHTSNATIAAHRHGFNHVLRVISNLLVGCASDCRSRNLIFKTFAKKAVPNSRPTVSTPRPFDV